MSITVSMLEIVKQQMAKHDVTRLKSLKIKVGELTAVEPDSLRFCFEVCTKGTPLEGASLDIEDVPLRGRCAGCGAEFRIEHFLQACPACGGAVAAKTSGSELAIVSMEAE